MYLDKLFVYRIVLSYPVLTPNMHMKMMQFVLVSTKLDSMHSGQLVLGTEDSLSLWYVISMTLVQ